MGGGNNMESMLLGGDDSSSGESDTEAVGVAAQPPAAAQAPAAPAPPPPPAAAANRTSSGGSSNNNSGNKQKMSHSEMAARLKNMYSPAVAARQLQQQQPQRQQPPAQPQPPTSSARPGGGAPTQQPGGSAPPPQQQPQYRSSSSGSGGGGVPHQQKPHRIPHQTLPQHQQQQQKQSRSTSLGGGGIAHGLSQQQPRRTSSSSSSGGGGGIPHRPPPPPQQPRNSSGIPHQVPPSTSSSRTMPPHQQQHRHSGGSSSRSGTGGGSQHSGPPRMPPPMAMRHSTRTQSDPFEPTPVAKIIERSQQKAQHHQVAQQQQQVVQQQQQRLQQHQQQQPRGTVPQQQSQPRGGIQHQQPPAAAGSGSTSASAAAAAKERDLKKQKEKFLIFTRVLMKYLEQKDPPLHQKVKAIIKDCAIRNRNKEPGYEIVAASMKIQLRKVVNDNYWKRAEAYLDHFLKAKAKEGSQSAKLLSSTTGGGGSGSSSTGAANVKSGGASASAPSTSMQHHHRHAVKKPKRPLSAYNFFFQLEHDRIVKGDGKDRDTIVKYTAEDIAGIALIQQKKAKENNRKEKLSHLNGNSFSNLARTIGNNWKKLDDPSKAIFEQKASIDKERYRKELAEWNKQQQTKQSGAKPKVSPSTHAQSPSLQFCVCYKAPETLHHASDLDRFLDQVTGHSSCSAKYDDCPICLRSLQTTQKVSKLKACHHSFCHSCIVSSLQHSRSCPICRKVIDTPQGKMPSGSMTARRTQMRCDGCSHSLRIDYSLDGGTQKMYHVNPGVPYRSCRRIAYLPDNEKGHALLMRLKYAFECGLTFTIGTSLTTGRPNAITWSSIHHKTTLSGGVHGFPDPNYFQNANEELDALGVPKADDL